MYTITAFGQMITDPLRIGPYVDALRRAVQPGSVVVDIGSGTGIFALLACQFGAVRVYAIEPDPALQLARQLAAANGYQDRISFVQDMSTNVTLPERADVIISDLRGSLPWLQQHLPTIADARRRFLAPGGVLIPQQDQVWAAVVSAPECYERNVSRPWQQNALGLDLRAGQRLVANNPVRCRVNPDALLSEPALLATIDYTSVESPDVQAELELHMTQPGTGHGLLLWFSTLLAPEIGFSTGPGQPQSVYGTLLFPWPAPLVLDAGDAVQFAFHGTLFDDNYDWRWYTRVYEQGQLERPKAQFKQGTMLGRIVTPEQIRRGDHRHCPQLSQSGQVAQFVLGLMDGTHSLNAIADAVLERFPEQFPSRQAARSTVGNLVQRYWC